MTVPRHPVHKCPKDLRPDPHEDRYWTCPECGMEWERGYLWLWPRRRVWRPAKHPDYGYITFDATRYYRWSQQQWAQRRAKERAKQQAKQERKRR